MTLQVTIYDIKNYQDNIVGTINLDGDRLYAEPEGDALLEHIIKRPVIDMRTRQPVRPTHSPRLWMHSLYFYYSSAYLRASKAVEVNQPPQSNLGKTP